MLSAKSAAEGQQKWSNWVSPWLKLRVLQKLQESTADRARVCATRSALINCRTYCFLETSTSINTRGLSTRTKLKPFSLKDSKLTRSTITLKRLSLRVSDWASRRSEENLNASTRPKSHWPTSICLGSALLKMPTMRFSDDRLCSLSTSSARMPIPNLQK